MPQLCVLKAKAFIDGAIQQAGYRFTLADGELGPHRAVRAVHPPINNAAGTHDHIEVGAVDEPLYDVLDPDHEAQVVEMQERHRKEREDADGTTARAELAAKHAEESATLRRAGEAKNLEVNQRTQTEALAARQDAERKALESRPPRPVAMPLEATMEDLEARHKAEAEALAQKHEREAAELVGAHPDIVAQESAPALPPAGGAADEQHPASHPASPGAAAPDIHSPAQAQSDLRHPK